MFVAGVGGAAFSQLQTGLCIASGIVGGAGGSIVSYTPTLTSIGVQAGDLAIVYPAETAGAPSSGGGSWTTVGGGTAYFRLLTGGDIAASGKIGCVAGNFAYAVYRGPRSIAFIASDTVSGGEPTKTIAGFTKHSTHAGLLSLSRHYVPLNGGTPGLPTTPATWTTRQIVGNNADDAYRRIADRLMPANTLYVDGTDIQWTTYFGSIPAEGDTIAIFEFRA